MEKLIQIYLFISLESAFKVAKIGINDTNFFHFNEDGKIPVSLFQYR